MNYGRRCPSKNSRLHRHPIQSYPLSHHLLHRQFRQCHFRKAIRIMAGKTTPRLTTSSRPFIAGSASHALLVYSGWPVQSLWQSSCVDRSFIIILRISWHGGLLPKGWSVPHANGYPVHPATPPYPAIPGMSNTKNRFLLKTLRANSRKPLPCFMTAIHRNHGLHLSWK